MSGSIFCKRNEDKPGTIQVGKEESESKLMGISKDGRFLEESFCIALGVRLRFHITK